VITLLSEAFPGFSETEVAARRHGLSWERCSTPFVIEDHGTVIAHVGLLEMTFAFDDVERRIGGIHAVAARESHRGLGHIRSLLEEAVAYGLERYDGLVLTAGVPPIYERFGFEVVPEHRFLCTDPPACGSDRGRELEWDDSNDLARLHRLLERRQPVSRRLGAVHERDVFLYTTARSRLRWLPELECVAWMSSRDGTLILHDLVAERVPTLAQLLSCLSGPVDRVIAEFCPDRLDAVFEPEPHVLDGDDFLMAHGTVLLDSLRRGSPIAIARSSRC
jgi:predicted N-acetyltransferase YhbS